MPFDPKQYIAEKTGQAAPSGGFDPKKYISEKSGNAQPSQDAPADSVFADKENRYRPNMAAAAVNGLQKGGSLSFAPIGAAGLSALISTLKGDNPVSGIGQAYRNAKEDIHDKQRSLEETYPKMTAATELLGSLVPAAFTGGESTLAGMLKSGAKIGGGLAFANSPAELTTGNPEEYKKALEDTLEGAGYGMGTNALFHGALNTVAPEALKRFANRRIAKATGVLKNDIKNLEAAPVYEKGKLVPGVSQLDQYGDQLFKNNIVPTFGNPETILDNARRVKATEGKNIGNMINKFDENYNNINTPVATSHEIFPTPSKIADEVQALQDKTLGPRGVPLNVTDASNQALQKIGEDVSQYGNTPITFKEAQELKQFLKKAAYDPVTGKPIESDLGQAAHKGYGVVNRNIENAAEQNASFSGNDELSDRYINSKKAYGTADIAENASLGKTSANLAHSDIGLIPAVMGAAQAAHGNPAIIGGVLATKAWNTAGPALTGHAANQLSKASGFVHNVGSAIYAIPKAGLKAFANKLITTGPESDVKIGQLLLKAAEKDDVGKNAILFTLMQQPAYRDLINNYYNQPNQETPPIPGK